MALIKLKDGKVISVSEERGNTIWKVLTREQELEGSGEVQSFLDQVKRVYLDRHRTDLPNTYILKYRDTWAAMDKTNAKVPRPTKGLKDWIDSKHGGSST